MATFRFEVAQRFSCVYAVDGDTPEEAWANLLSGGGRCHNQDPEEILDSPQDMDACLLAD